MRKFLFLLLIISFLSVPCLKILAQDNHLLIVEIQITGVNSQQDYIKIYNPTGQPINISQFKLRKKSQKGKTYSLKVIPSLAIIQPKQYIIWANSRGHFADLIQANYTSQANLSINNSIALLNQEEMIVDSVSWGKINQHFGNSYPFPQNPTAHQLLKRKLDQGQYLDSGDNRQDFFLENKLTSSPRLDNLVLGSQSPKVLPKWLTLGMAISLGILSVIIILFLKNFKS